MFAARAARRPYQTPAGPEITALQTSINGGQIQFSGEAADNRYFRGFSTELPIDDPVADVVEVTVSLGVPPYLANQTYVFPVTNPAVQTSFSGNLPPGTLLPDNTLLFAVASDADGVTGVPRVTAINDALFNDGFEAM